jgi:pimeloyl-ACP methyl ester carboxylesterase
MAIESTDLPLPRGTVRVHLAGPAGGPVLCFVHGAPVSANLWFGLIERLAPNYRCIAPELPLGSHPIPLRADADTSPPAVADLVVELLDALSIEQATLVGNDSGGAIAQLIAARHPSRVARRMTGVVDVRSAWDRNSRAHQLRRGARRQLHFPIQRQLHLPIETFLFAGHEAPAS